MPSDAFSLSVECVRWAQLARYDWNSTEGLLRRPGEDGYAVLARPDGRAELVQLADDGTSERVLYAADREVLERYLFGLFADDIREDIDLPLLELGWARDDLADGYQLSDMVRGYRTLRRTSGEPVAAAPDPTLSLLALVPLSNYLRWSIADLKRSFLNPAGVPLLRHGRYASH